jgi:nicotinamide riboside transporter PnuC
MANLLTLCLIVITNLLIWRRMRQSLLPEQQHSVEVSRQVGRVLLLQATIPLLLTFIPAIVLILSIYFGQNVSFLSSFLYAQTWTCAIYPVAAMAMIGHYRRRIKKLIMSWKHGQSTVYPSTQ